MAALYQSALQALSDDDSGTAIIDHNLHTSLPFSAVLIEFVPIMSRKNGCFNFIDFR